tara:strand:+ start:238 stop:495 length:258 start_codon:yes stop_codon:yes gene_type:complete
MKALLELLKTERLNAMERRVAMLQKAVGDIESHLKAHPLLVNQRPFLDMLKALEEAQQYIYDDFNGAAGIEDNVYVKAYHKGLGV